MLHGDADYGIPVEQSQVMYDRLKERDYDVQYVELKGKGHFWLYRAEKFRPDILSWLRKTTRGDPPKEYTYRTYSLKFDRGYWATVRGLKDWSRAAEVTCRLDPKAGKLEVETSNVLSLFVEPPAGLGDDPEDLKVEWNGNDTEPELMGERRFRLGRLDEDKKLVKTKKLCGPVREAFGSAFVMVHGGEGTSSYDLALHAAKQWKRYAKGSPWILAAEEVTDEIRRKNNLIVFGTPDQNKLTARVLPDLPLGLDKEKVEIGDRSYRLTDRGVWLVYPSPFASGRYVVINAGIPWGKELAPNHVYDMIPDFIVYTRGRATDVTECNQYLSAGYFDQYWQFAPESTWHNEPAR
jgi:hypothetical protein